MKKWSLKRWYFVSVFLSLLVLAFLCGLFGCRLHTFYVGHILGASMFWLLVSEGVRRGIRNVKKRMGGGSKIEKRKWSRKKLLGYTVFTLFLIYLLISGSIYGYYFNAICAGILLGALIFWVLVSEGIKRGIRCVKKRVRGMSELKKREWSRDKMLLYIGVTLVLMVWFIYNPPGISHKIFVIFLCWANVSDEFEKV